MKSKKWNWLLVAAAAVLIAVCGSNVKAAETGTVYVSVEKFTIGQGYLVEPVVAALNEGEDYGDVINRVLKEAGYECDISYGWGTPYLETIYGSDSGVINLPECIKNVDESVTAVFGDVPTNDAENANYPDLAEYSYSWSSGWMYCINDDYSGMAELSDGDVLRYQFSVYGWGYDIGSDVSWSGLDNMDIPDRTDVTRQLAILNEDLKTDDDAKAAAVYADAISVVSDLDSTAEEIAAAEEAVTEQIALCEERAAAEENKDDSKGNGNANNKENGNANNKENGNANNKINSSISNSASNSSAAAVSSSAAASSTTKKVSVGKVKLKKVKKAGSKKVKLKWKKVKGASGYQIKMSKKKKGGYKVVKTVKKGSKKTCKVGKLKKGKKYYFKVRAYKKVNGKTYYGKYSKKIKVKL